jgi:CheY-like chemotaxis protein
MDRILVVDDEADIVNLTRIILEKDGYWVSSANNGEEALQMLEREDPDLVLLDLVMPGKSGLEVCKIIKTQPRTKNIPVIMFTALGRDVDRKLTSWAGADSHFTKPFAKDQLLSEVKKWLKEARCSKFSKLLGIEHEKLRGKKILVEIDPRSDYEKAVVDFVTECVSHEEAVVVVTQKGSAVRQCLHDNEDVELVDLDSRIKFSPLLNEHPDGPLNVVFDSLTDLVLIVEDEEATQSWLYKFAQNSLQVLADSRITGLFLLNPAAHDPQSIASIRGIFNDQIAYDAQGVTVTKQAH